MTINGDLQKVRDEIRLADEALVRDLVALEAAPVPVWERRAMALPAYRIRVSLGVKVADSKFRQDPERYRPLARKHDEVGLEQAITDEAVEAAVLDRVRQQALALGADAGLAGRVADLYRGRIIPETKRFQIRWLFELA
jgi:chorismate mutase